MAIKGLDQTVRNLNRQIAGIKGRTETGLSQAGRFVQAEAQAKTPIQFGVLRGSAFNDTAIVATNKIVTRVGYTAEYAPFVHEMPETNNFRSPGTGPKFLQKAVTEGVREIIAIIQQRARIPGGGT